MEHRGPKPEKNLMEAFAGESMARNKYTFFASVARKEGYEQLAAIFEETAGNEKEHAKIWFKLLCGEDKNAAQLEFVIGSNGGGLSHDLWRENLKLACAVQETLYKDYPTLMRPVTVRNSRYNQHMTTGSLLVEVGTAGNSLEEAVNAARLFAAGFAKTIQNGT